MKRRPTLLIRRAKQVLRLEGPGALARRGLSFMGCRFFVHRMYYLSEFRLENVRHLDESAFKPQLDDLTFKIVSTNQEADELEQDGYEFRSYPYDINAIRALDSGAIAFCVFIGKELASIGWVALERRAMKSLNEPPIRIEFPRDALTAPIWTHPKYRGMGLRAYRGIKLRRFLLDRGAVMTRGCMPKTNISALRGLAKIDSTIYAEGRYLKLLWWKWWSEKPLQERLDPRDIGKTGDASRHKGVDKR